MAKAKVIIYGLGNQFKRREKYLEEMFDIIGYSDSKELRINKYIRPSQIKEQEFEYIYITSMRYFEEIKKFLVEKLGIHEKKIISEKETVWYIDNDAGKEKWLEKKLAEIPAGKALLDAGAGELRYKKYCGHLRYISQDFGEYDDSEKSEGLHPEHWDTKQVDIVSDITSIPLQDGSMDAILCTEVFEHIKNPVLALKEFSRILRKNGILLLTAPFCSLAHFAPYYFYNGFSKYWYKEYLSEFGFEIKEMKANGNYFDYLRQELLRLPYMANNYCVGYFKEGEIEDRVQSSLTILKQLSDMDRNSSEVLCFGFMVEARKS